MSNYNTNLETWGSSGSSPPTGYSYTKDEPPVDEWDNHTMYNSIEDIKHLITLTNSRIESDKGPSGSEPASPESSHFYFDEDNNRLEIWDSSSASWKIVPYSSEVTSYTDTDAISAVDSTVDNAATSVADLDDTVAGKSDEGHDHTGADEVNIPDAGLVEDYVTSTEASSYTDSDAISAVDGEVNNASTTVAGLDDAVAGKAESTAVSSIQSSSDVNHDSTAGGTDADAHHSRYTDSEAVSAVDGEVDNAAGSVAGLDNAVTGKASDNHDNSAHSTAYLDSSGGIENFDDFQAITSGSASLSPGTTTLILSGWSLSSSNNIIHPIVSTDPSDSNADNTHNTAIGITNPADNGSLLEEGNIGVTVQSDGSGNIDVKLINVDSTSGVEINYKVYEVSR